VILLVGEVFSEGDNSVIENKRASIAHPCAPQQPFPSVAAIPTPAHSRRGAANRRADKAIEMPILAQLNTAVPTLCRIYDPSGKNSQESRTAFLELT
jgi:hypothetical protein